MEALRQELQIFNEELKNLNEGYGHMKRAHKQEWYESDLLEILSRLDNLLSLDFRVLGIPYELLPADAIIDIFITYNSLNEEIIIVPPPNSSIYPLDFPYSGMRGPRSEIEQVFLDYFGNTASALPPFIFSNEPISITPWEFKTTSILKPDVGLDGRNTLIGIIDTGIDYTNPIFIDTNGQTRIASIWDQTIGADSPYGYGTVYDKEMINAALQSPNPFELVPHKDEVGHGTILAGIAAGLGENEKGSYKGVAPGADLVIVKLKPASDVMQTLFHGKYNPLAFSGLDIALAFQFLIILANQMKKPISICLPSGTNSGSHDGTDVIDSIITAYSSNSGICSVISVGDEGNKSHHASGNLKEEKEQTIKLIIPKGQAGFVVEIWAAFGDRIKATLTPPKFGGNALPSMLLNEAKTYKVLDTSSVWTLGIRFDVNTGCQVIRFRFENPIEGEWLITVEAVTVINGIYNIWIPKTGMILPETVLSPANSFTTIYNTSTSEGVIAIGCYAPRSQTACQSSGRGFTRGNEVAPDFIVTGVDIPGPLPGNKWGTITGAAPSSAIAVGITSLIYEDQLIREDELANTVIMKAILVDRVKRQPTVLYPNPSSGYGLIDINLE